MQGILTDRGKSREEEQPGNSSGCEDCQPSSTLCLNALFTLPELGSRRISKCVSGICTKT